ncbi:MAG: YdcF family protein [Caldilineaceae bacterium]|nr:YdcF family protein [Caldilineaceae bacterium]
MTRTLSSPAFGPPRFFRRPAWLSLLALGLVAALIAFPYLWRAWVDQRYSRHIYALDTALTQEAHARVAVVYGARVYAGGRLSGMLRDRVDTAIALYKAGKVDKLLLSGDNQTLEYDEPGAMLAYAAAQGVPLEDLQPDYGGRRTYDTCYRARHVFQLDAAVLVTQEFHLPRALFTCRALGIDAVGVIADRRPYDPRSVAWSESRELPALVMALFDVVRRAPAPVLGEPIPLL